MIQTETGPTAIPPYSFAGTEGIVQMNWISERFFARLGATKLERNICGDMAVAGLAGVIGAGTHMIPEDIRKSRFIILWGTNTVNTNQHLWPFIEEARSNGARLVVINPRRSKSAEKADWHLQPIPGTDAALALGMMHPIIRKNWIVADYVFPATTQLEHWDILTSWGQRFISLNEPAIEPLDEAKSNSEFFRLLSDRLGLKEDYLYESDLEIIKKFSKVTTPI